MFYLDFEQKIASLEGRLTELTRVLDQELAPVSSEAVAQLEREIKETTDQLYSNLTPAQIIQVARHPQRPHALEYINSLFDDFTLLAGDRGYGDDRAVIAGLGRFRGSSVAILGQEKGADTETRLLHNFGMPMPEGYRKAIRIMELADRFGLPVISFIDTAGAFPGVEAEARGQAQAIASSISACLDLKVPSIAVIIGEAMSGGAMAVAAMSRVYMLQYAVYNVISPEGAASILWRDSTKAQDAAEAMQFTADSLLKLKVIDQIIPESLGGAHRHPKEAIASVGDIIEAGLREMSNLSPDQIHAEKRNRFLDIGRELG
ncbi:acetyl-coenzyme A carboxylase carboxyl transferase subunit alpha [Pseudovibrio japonicus]|uniref:Acetyl-coenzyme A carboxylase carboxyl transferase subunit alpha n=2 Tax=Pseudovibrio japonicus TaxID=366534 RepID=A0ABQ3E1I7_9HYPH|nr:acetyl-coenzyme A carboxylase carboxyl transferase subunit alpha [Pseudovibrio japonicus]